jgi:hypothetical protein
MGPRIPDEFGEYWNLKPAKVNCTRLRMLEVCWGPCHRKLSQYCITSFQNGQMEVDLYNYTAKETILLLLQTSQGHIVQCASGF